MVFEWEKPWMLWVPVKDWILWVSLNILCSSWEKFPTRSLQVPAGNAVQGGIEPWSPSGCAPTELRAPCAPCFWQVLLCSKGCCRAAVLLFLPQLLGSASPELLVISSQHCTFPQYTCLSSDVMDATTLQCTGSCEGFLKPKGNSVLNVAQRWRCGGDAFSSENTTAVSRPGCCLIAHLPRSSDILSTGSGAAGLARSLWEGDGERGPFEGSCVCQRVQSPSSLLHDSGTPQWAAEGAGCLAGEAVLFSSQCWALLTVLKRHDSVLEGKSYSLYVLLSVILSHSQGY